MASNFVYNTPIPQPSRVGVRILSPVTIDPATLIVTAPVVHFDANGNTIPGSDGVLNVQLTSADALSIMTTVFARAQALGLAYPGNPQVE